MKKIFLLAFILSACAAKPQPTSIPEIIKVYSTPAAQPWMGDLFACANGLSVGLNVTSDSPDIFLRVGEPDGLVQPAYQIDEEEILIVTNHQSPLQNLSLEQVQDLFAGQGDASVQVWVYSSDADLQILFDQLVMKGRAVTSSAMVATDPQQMSNVLNSQTTAVGILPKHWKAGSLRDMYSAGIVPVLAITQTEPRPIIKQLIACLQ